MVIAQVVEASTYAFTAYSVPTLITALGILVLGFTVLVRERISQVSISFFLLTLYVSIWLFCFSCAYSSASESAANFWLRAGYLGVPFIAPATLHFTLVVLGKYERLKALAWACWLPAVGFSILSLFTDVIIVGPRHFFWGYYASFAWSGLSLIIYFCLVLVVSMAQYLREYRTGRLGELGILRVRALMGAFAVGYVGAADFIPVFGVPLYPFGFLPIAGFIVLSARAIWKYRLVDITPAFAARQIIETMNDALLVFDAEGVVRLANEAAFQLFECGDDHQLIGHVASTAFKDGFFASQIGKLLASDPVTNYELAYSREDGRTRTLNFSSSAMRDVHGLPRATVLIARDITEHKTFQERLEHHALHDALTNLPNRALFIETLTHAVRRTRPETEGIAVLFVDVDNFKVVNDSLGHNFGDRLIVSTGRRLRECLEAGTTLARFGADEFAILMESASSSDDAVKLAEKIQAAFKQPILAAERDPASTGDLDVPELSVTVSIGVTFSGSQTSTPDELLRGADVAMQEAKGNGKAQSVLYNPSLDSRARFRLQREIDLRWAFERQELEVYYQPLVSLETGRLHGFEALLRWTHPERGPISPAEFIPLAEETGLIVPIGQWVLEKACRQLKVWQARYPEQPLLVSVNLSVRQFRHPGLLDDIARTLAQSHLDPSALQLEITESIGLEDIASASSIMWRLKELGVQLALDDFGTGYSALSYLKRFPIDTIKLDRSFITGLGQNAEDTAIIHAVIAFAKALRLSVTAEGIETRAQLAQLVPLGCDHGQGFLFARPAPADGAAALIERMERGTRHHAPYGDGREQEASAPAHVPSYITSNLHQ